MPRLKFCSRLQVPFQRGEFVTLSRNYSRSTDLEEGSSKEQKFRRLLETGDETNMSKTKAKLKKLLTKLYFERAAVKCHERLKTKLTSTWIDGNGDQN